MLLMKVPYENDIVIFYVKTYTIIFYVKTYTKQVLKIIFENRSTSVLSYFFNNGREISYQFYLGQRVHFNFSPNNVWNSLNESQ